MAVLRGLPELTTLFLETDSSAATQRDSGIHLSPLPRFDVSLPLSLSLSLCLCVRLTWVLGD